MNKKYKLKEIATIMAGSAAPKEKYFYEDEGIPFIRAGHLKELLKGHIDLSALPKIRKDDNLKLKKVPKGTILFAKSGMSSTKNNIYNCTGDAYIVSHLVGVIPNEKIIMSNYLLYFLRFYQPSRLIMNESYPSIRIEDIQNIELEIPSIEKQAKIVKIFSECESLINNRQFQITALDELAHVLFLEMFGNPKSNSRYPKKPLKSFGKIITGNTPPRKEKDNYGTEIEWIKSDNINTPNTYLSLADEYLSAKGKKKGRIVPPNSILVTCITGSKSSLGNVALTDREVAFNQQINAVIPENVNPYFLYMHFLIDKSSIQNAATNGMKGIVTKSVFQEIRFISPPLSAQNEYGEKFLEIEIQKSKIIDSLKEMQSLYDSLLQEFFR
ncbi:restriction endonuclease subunit S [Exiguobacterium sp. s59]|uniref:restriction endonuclease subunit S n=1 Tax=Exiguobacterium sp. s59 TaxID=2751269 RepID=UPI001BE774A9|nr:restriction endonuclease subunit S [Exiguobacterium sp. s59]